MTDQLGCAQMSSREASPISKSTIPRARDDRALHAIAATIYADRVEQARAPSRPGAMARWTAEYRRSTATCRRIGEIIRSEREAA
jgi:hypothetical protein